MSSLSCGQTLPKTCVYWRIRWVDTWGRQPKGAQHRIGSLSRPNPGFHPQTSAATVGVGAQPPPHPLWPEVLLKAARAAGLSLGCLGRGESPVATGAAPAGRPRASIPDQTCRHMADAQTPPLGQWLRWAAPGWRAATGIGAVERPICGRPPASRDGLPTCAAGISVRGRIDCPQPLLIAD